LLDPGFVRSSGLEFIPFSFDRKIYEKRLAWKKDVLKWLEDVEIKGLEKD